MPSTTQGDRARVLEELCVQAIALYRVRLLDNIDLDRLDEPTERARVISRALMERGDARAFFIGRKISNALGG